MGEQEHTSNRVEHGLGFWAAHELKVSWDANTCNFEFELKESLGSKMKASWSDIQGILKWSIGVPNVSCFIVIHNGGLEKDTSETHM